MFPRVLEQEKKSGTYKYLIIQESVWEKGKKSTRTVSNLGSINKFREKDIKTLIEGLIRIFNIDDYTKADDIDIIESLEYGNILLWKTLWEKLGLTEVINKICKKKDKRIKINVGLYTSIMVFNRCITPSSKLKMTRWFKTTSLKLDIDYKEIINKVNYYYRSMDHLIKIKDKLEEHIFYKLRTLFSINIKITFYDITSTYFEGTNCDIALLGHTRDHRPDRPQIVIGVVTTYEGYPIKHYVFEGNRQDSTTVQEVIKDLKKSYKLEEVTFVGDRGMITKLNIKKLESGGFKYIFGVKLRQNKVFEEIIKELNWKNAERHGDLLIKGGLIDLKEYYRKKVSELLLKWRKEIPGLDNILDQLFEIDFGDYKEFKIKIKRVLPEIKLELARKIYNLIENLIDKKELIIRYVLCLNPERQKTNRKKREKWLKIIEKEIEEKIQRLKAETDIQKITRLMESIFDGRRKTFRKYYNKDNIKPSKAGLSIEYRRIDKVVKFEEKLDGVFGLMTTDKKIGKEKVVSCYKNLKEVEELFDGLKNFVEIQPTRHWTPERVRAHVFICILALLLKRIFEIDYQSKSISEPLEEIEKLKLISYEVPMIRDKNEKKIISKLTRLTENHKRIFHRIGIKNPNNLEKYL